MRINNRLLTIVSNVAILIGVTLGIFGIVRGGSLFLAVGTAGRINQGSGAAKLVSQIGNIPGLMPGCAKIALNAGPLMVWNIPKKNGSWMSSGKHPPSGLALFSLQTRRISCCNFSG